MTEFCVFIPLQSIAPGNSWIGGVSLKDYKIIWKIKIRETKIKQYLKTLIVLWVKWTGMVKRKHKDFIAATLVVTCQNSSWIMGLRIYGEGRTQIPLSLPVRLVPWQGPRIDMVYTDIKIANDTKINHIMVSFTDHYNAISIDRLHSKTKIGKNS